MRSRSRSRSPVRAHRSRRDRRREERREHSDRHRDGRDERRDYVDRHRERSNRDKERDRDHDRDRERDRTRDHERRNRRSRSRSPRRRKHESPEGSKAVAMNPQLLERPEITEKDLEGKTEEEIEMMKLMGFGGFETTKGKPVTGNDVSAVNILQKRKYRQYMNRKGGFNRPLDFVA